MCDHSKVYPLFSVIIPVYNMEKFIKRAINSVLLQNIDNFELIVVDDGSTDEGAVVIEGIDDPRIKLIKQPNKGVASARNTGVLNAKGEWVAFLDADDLWGTEHLSELKDLIKKFPDAGMVCTSSREVINGGDTSFLDIGHKEIHKKIDYFKSASVQIGIVHTSSVAIEKKIFEKLSGFSNYKLGQDLELWARVALETVVAKSFRPTVVYFRGTGGAIETQMEWTKISSRPIPQSLQDISPSVSTLSKRLPMLSADSDSDSDLYWSVVSYINGRLSKSIRGAFIQGDTHRMKGISRLRIVPCGEDSYKWFLISKLPLWLLTGLSRIREFIKNSYRK